MAEDSLEATEQAALYRHRGTRAVQRMVEYAPCTGGLALWVHHRDLDADADATAESGAAPVSTDGRTITYRAAFERLPTAVQAGWIGHEVLHIALRHAQRLRELRQLLGDVDARLFNTCADAIVNSTLSHLTWLQLPRDAVHLDRLLQLTLGISQPVEKSLLEWDVERLYRAIDDRRPARSGASKDGARPQDPREDGASRHADAGAASRASAAGATTASRRVDGPRAACVRLLGANTAADLAVDPDASLAGAGEAEEAREWSERLLRAHAGDGVHSMLRALIADLPRSRTPWPQVLRTRLAHALARRPDVSWSRPSRSYLANQGRAGPHRRLPWEPGTSHAKPEARLALVVDVSGSIDDDLLARFAREVEAITRRYEAALVLVVGDCAVRHVEHCDPGHCDLREISFRGGGGTDFSPLLEEADRHRPDIGVVLTDLEGPADFRPRWPVVWAVTPEHAAAAAPFGRKLVLD